MKCPNCKLENPSGALTCDCGYAFSGESQIPQLHHLQEIARDLRTIKRIMLAFLILTICGGLATGIYNVRREAKDAAKTSSERLESYR